MQKILIIPSWYATKETPGRATFFREQAILFKDDYDIRVIAGVLNNKLNRAQKIWNTFKFLLFTKVSVSKKHDFFLTPPDVDGFEYEKGLNRLNRLNFKIMIQAWVLFFEKEILPQWKPDLIHAQNTFIAGIIARHISLKHNIPYIITDHHHLNPHYDDYVRNEIKLAFKHSAENCFVSEWQYRTYLLLDPNLKGIVVNNLLDDDVFKIKKRKQKDIFTIIHVSNGFYWKDIHTLAGSFDKLYEKLKRIDNIRLLIIGMNKKTIENLVQLISHKEIINKIEAIHQIQHHLLPEYYQQSDVFVFSSAFESFGITPLEAMLCGVPVVATSNGGIDEYLIHGVNGIKVPIKDADGLAQGIMDIYQKNIQFDPEEVRKSVVGKLNKSSFKKLMMKIYNESMAK